MRFKKLNSEFFNDTRNIRFILTLFVLCVTFVCIGVFSVKDDNLVNDETAHIPSGYAALKEQNFILNLEHPPMLKMIAAVPMLFQKVNYKSDLVSNTPADEWKEGYRFFDLNKSNFDTVLLSGRVALILFHAFFLFVLGLLLKQIISPVFACLGVFFIAFEPNFLAHARYITTDAGITVFTVLSLVSFGVFLERQQRIYIWLTAVFLGGALLSKFSGLAVYFLILAFLMFNRFKQMFNAKRTFALIFIVPVLMLYLVYFGVGWAINPMQLNFVITNDKQATEPSWQTNVFFRPVVLYKTGLKHITERTQLGAGGGHPPQYLNGEIRYDKGWWYYFLIALLYKETPILLILFASGLLFFRWRNHKTQPLEIMLLLYSVLYLSTTFTSSLNIGIRHIQPMIATLTLFSVLVLSYQHFWLKFRLWHLAVVLQLLSIISVYPYYLAYFNVIAGGPANGYKHLLDSNLDWGQNLKRLYIWAQKNKIDKMIVQTWIGTPVDYYDEGKIFKPPPKQQLYMGHGYPEVYFAVNITSIKLSKESLGMLESLTPVAIIGHSIYVYHFP
ncbi:MAG: glycosyltransferase family 39 protein [Nitrospirae bacterium YQR-1]